MDSNRAVCGRRGRRDYESETKTRTRSKTQTDFSLLDLPTRFGTIACNGNSFSSSSNSSVQSSAASDRADRGHGDKPRLTSENLARSFGTRHRSARSSTAAAAAATTAGSLDSKPELTLLGLPTELHLDIVEICVMLNGWGDNHKGSWDKKYIGGAVRELTQVNRYFRELTAPYLFKNICINDKTEATMKDLLKESIQAIMTSPRTHQWLPKIEKFTVSLTRTPQPNHQYVEEDLILILDLVRPKTQRFVIEEHSTQWQLLCLVENVWRKWALSGFPHRIYNTKQLEISAPFGHNWNFQFLANPYVNVERMWLDYNCDLLEPRTLNLARLANLEYLMVRSFPAHFLDDANDLARFHGWGELPDEQPKKLAALARTLPHLKHLAMCGLLNEPIENLAARLAPMKSLEQLDITDQQAVSARQVMEARTGAHDDDATDWAIAHSRLIREHVFNTGRADAAVTFFEAIPSLKRICFVRDQVGTVFHAVRSEKDDGEPQLVRAEARETITAPRRYLKWQSPKAWLCGFPNVLGYELFDGSEESYVDTIRSDATFWL
ncbi:putative f-box domain-containing protein [Diaporthe ampelina]|uniref:Putative f-box domain-containing protein n=1 Tax=Diaporthe ampelina TaxID=1214573 RepID=A0A0G2FIK7_9PEZI|nr:putative f-box domain-containing protein [Diaporthe ampelina]